MTIKIIIVYHIIGILYMNSERIRMKNYYSEYDRKDSSYLLGCIFLWPIKIIEKIL